MSQLKIKYHIALSHFLWVQFGLTVATNAVYLCRVVEWKGKVKSFRIKPLAIKPHNIIELNIFYSFSEDLKNIIWAFFEELGFDIYPQGGADIL